MKIKVELINGNEHRSSGSHQGPTVSHIFDGETAVKDHIKVLLAHFKIPIDKVSSYALQNPNTLTYVEDLFLTPEKLVEAEKSYFILRMKPIAIADRVVEILKDSNSSSIKDTIFNIRYQMKDVEYVEEFIAKGGINHLLAVIIRSRGNTQSYALTALRCFMGYNSGLEEVMGRPHLIDRLYALVCTSGILPSVCRQALELLFCVCNFDGFNLVHRASKNYALETGTPPYSILIALLASGDMETQLNTLTLFNCLLDNAPNPRKNEKLLSRWQTLGIVKILKSQEHVTHSDFRTQIARFQTNSGFGIDGCGRKRTLTRQLSNQELEYQLHQFREQQPLVHLLTMELKFLRNAIKSAIENGSYINYRAPTERYDEYTAKKMEIVGDTPTNLLFLKRNDKFTSAFRKSMYVRSPNTSDLFDQTTLDETYDSSDEFESSSATTTPNQLPINLQQHFQQKVHPQQQSQQNSPLLIKDKPSKTNEEEDNSNINTNSNSNNNSNNNINNNNSTALNTTPTSNKSTPTPKPAHSFLLSPITISSHMNAMNQQKQESSPPQPTNEKEVNLSPIQNNNQLNEQIKSKIQPSKPPINPQKRMKPLHWTRVLNGQFSEKKTIWNSFLPEVKFEEELFIDLFSLYTERIVSYNVSPTFGSSSISGPTKSRPIQRVISVLSQKRSNAITVLCGKILPDESLIKAIRQLDSNKLSLENINNILSNFPTPEELASIHELHSNDVILDKPERWCLMIDGFPKIKHRLKTWEYLLKFDELLRIIDEAVDTVSIASKELRSSQTINFLFSLLLSLGNYLNGGHPYRGQCDGFNLESISKMIELKDNTNSGSLLDFAIKTLYQTVLRTQNTTIHNELSHVPQASLINFTEMGSQLAKLSYEFIEVKHMAEEIISTTDQDDPYLIVVPIFLENANKSLKSLTNKFVETEKLLFETIDYFNPSNQSLQQYQYQQCQNLQQQQNQYYHPTLSPPPINTNSISLQMTSSLNISSPEWNSQKFTCEKFFTLFSTIITAFKKSPSKRLSQKGFGLKISNTDDPMAVIIEALKTGSPNDMTYRSRSIERK
ncbi:hypothetical protein DICPUDRAFT_50865 [Dictyostelium purpureum]|uniref:FH2 domain-containing protein n=1 Tax=Dictyostelium purpureum TaxID=5786 RepID=F1A0P8_DICPU|nr:uncharacterized protein DICPUDRAFT_50865 [Dictyostelium purpureum]EGC30227.1 hypothetical protein DICPUDRAFT_50865 [Dictyostelium purpureum]|eukprot:XP_003293241.1 hypothetical protein DICPUDRAFT_50865 [Dictyostelium purpureum]